MLGCQRLALCGWVLWLDQQGWACLGSAGRLETGDVYGWRMMYAWPGPHQVITDRAVTVLDSASSALNQLPDTSDSQVLPKLPMMQPALATTAHTSADK